MSHDYEINVIIFPECHLEVKNISSCVKLGIPPKLLMSFSLSTPLTDPASVWDHGDLCVVRAVGARWKSERNTRTNFIFFFFLYLLCKCRVRGDRLTSAQVEASCNSCPLHLASHKMKPGGKATAIYVEAVCRERHRGLSSSTPTPSQPQ